MKPFSFGDLLLVLLELVLLLIDLDLEARLRGDILLDLKLDLNVFFDFTLSFADPDFDLSSEASSSVITGFDSLLKSK